MAMYIFYPYQQEKIPHQLFSEKNTTTFWMYNTEMFKKQTFSSLSQRKETWQMSYAAMQKAVDYNPEV